MMLPSVATIPAVQRIVTTSTTAAFPMGTMKKNLGIEDDPRAICTRDLIIHYLHVMKREMGDYIPKYLMFHLADRTISKISDGVVSI